MMQRQVQTLVWAVLMFVICSPVFAASTANQWIGSGPVATGLGNKVVTALAVSPDGGTVYAGTMSGTVFSYAVTPPTVTTHAASSVTATAATVSGNVNANNADSAVSFRYGTDTNYTLGTVVATPATVIGTVAVASYLGSLTPNTQYHYQVVATSTSGTTYGNDQTFTTLKLDQATLAVVSPTTMTFGNADATITTSGGSGSGLTTFDAGASTACSIVSGKLHVISATGTCSITATKDADNSYYAATSAAFSVTINKANQSSFTITGPAALTFGAAGATITNAGGSGTGTVTYSHGSSTACTVDSATGAVTVTSGTGTCAITATKVADNNYNALTSPTLTITINKADQATVTLNGLPATAEYNQSGIVASVNGGSSTGAISYSHGTSTACAVNSSSGAVTITKGSGTCAISATKAADANYNSITTAAATITVSPTNQQTLAIAGLPATAAFDQSGIFASTTGGTGTGAVTYSHGSSTACTIDPATGAVTIVSGSGTCSIIATKAADDNYNQAASAPVTVNIIKANQATLVIAIPTTMTFGETDGTITTSGGSGSGAITFSSGSSTACSIVADKLHVISATGTCSITATKATDSNYFAATSAVFAVTINKASQTTLAVTGPTGMTFAATDTTITYSGGSGTGTVTFSAGSSTACSVIGDKLHVVSGTGICAITATKAADADYNQATSVSFTVNISKANQTLTFSQPPAGTFPTFINIMAYATPGASGNPVTFSIIPGGTSSSSSLDTSVATEVILFSYAGTVIVQADQAGNDNYNPAAPVQRTVTINKLVAPVLFGAPPLLEVGTTQSVAATFEGGDVVHSSLTGSICSVTPSGYVTGLAVGRCIVAGDPNNDGNYITARATLEFDVKMAQVISMTEQLTKTYGVADFGSDAVVSSGLPLALTSNNPSVATITAAGLIHITGAGTARIAVVQPGNDSYWETNSEIVLTVNKAPLQVAANNASRAAGAVNPTFSVSYSGFVNGESGSVLTGEPTFSTTATPASPQGSYRITPAIGTLTAANYEFAFVDGTLAVDLVSQTIAFEPLPAKTYGDGPFDLTATGGASGKPIIFTSSDPAVATVAGATVTIVGPGTAIIEATQAGDAFFAPALAKQALTVNKPTLIVTVDDVSRLATAPNPTFTYKITGFVGGDSYGTAASGAPDIFTSDPAADFTLGTYPIYIFPGTFIAPKYNVVFVNGVMSVGLSSQSIVWSPLIVRTYGDAVFDLNATSNAGITPITYESSNPAVATVSGTTVTITGAGNTMIVARQAGNGSYAPSSKQQVLTVAKKKLTVIADGKSRAYNVINPALTASFSGFANGDTEAVLAGAPDLSTTGAVGSTVGNYPITITAGNLSAANYDFTYNNATLTVTQATPVITWSNPADITFGTSLSATQLNATASVAGTIIYTPANGALLNAGPLQTLSADFTPADAVNYTAASKTVVINVNKASQTIAFNPPATATYGDSTVTLSASATSGLPVTFAVTSGPASLTGNVLTITGAGDIVVTASQAGSANYNPAGSIQRTIAVGKTAATVTLGSLSHTYDGNAKAATATTSPAGKAVTFTYNGSATAPTAAGSYTVVATINDANYQGSATGTLTIGSTTQAITFGTAPTVYLGTTGTLSATASSGLSVSFTSTTPSICTVSGSTVSGVAPGTCTIAADQAGNGNYTAAAQVTQDIPVTVSIALSVSALANGATTTETTQNVSGIVTNSTYLSTLTINGVAVPVSTSGSFSYPVQLIAGANIITVIATGTSGDVLTDSRTITLDASAPHVTISYPPDNTAIIQPFVTVIGTVTPATATTVTCAVNGSTPQAASISGGDFTCTLNLGSGMNTIRVTATDSTGTTVQAKRTVTHATGFSLAITDPASDVRTVKSSYLLTGSVADNTTPVTVAIAMDGQTYTPTVAADGTFSQALTFTEGKVYQVTVTGTDQNGTTVTVQRNIIYSTPTVTPFTIEDALKALQMAVGVIPPQADLVQRLDVAPMVNGVSAGDGIIDVEDAIVILRIVVGLI